MISFGDIIVVPGIFRIGYSFYMVANIDAEDMLYCSSHKAFNRIYGFLLEYMYMLYICIHTYSLQSYLQHLVLNTTAMLISKKNCR